MAIFLYEIYCTVEIYAFIYVYSRMYAVKGVNDNLQEEYT
jgi:hypothetical protein